MIDLGNVYKFCRDDIRLIENFDEAITDRTNSWLCHHRLEVEETPNGIIRRSVESLIKSNHYYNRPANELIFVKRADHTRIHRKGIKSTEETKQKITNNHKGMTGRKHSEETKNKMSKAQTGSIKSEDTKKKMSEVAKKLSKNRNRDFHGRFC